MSDLTYNGSQSRYEMPVEGGTAFARVRRKGDVLFIDYVETPRAQRGSGLGSKFMTALMGKVCEENLKVVPICSFAASWLNRHPEYSDLKAPR